MNKFKTSEKFRDFNYVKDHLEEWSAWRDRIRPMERDIETVEELTAAMEDMVEVGEEGEYVTAPTIAFGFINQDEERDKRTLKAIFISVLWELYIMMEECPDGKLYWRWKPEIKEEDGRTKIFTRFFVTEGSPDDYNYKDGQEEAA